MSVLRLQKLNTNPAVNLALTKITIKCVLKYPVVQEIQLLIFTFQRIYLRGVKEAQQEARTDRRTGAEGQTTNPPVPSILQRSKEAGQKGGNGRRGGSGSVWDVTVPDSAAMQSMLESKHQKSRDSDLLAPCTLWPVDLKLTHLDWNPEATLIHFQGQYLNICELDYNILHREIQNVPKTEAEVDVGEFCLVEDLTSARWYRGRVQNRRDNFFDIFLIDYGNILSVSVTHISSCSNDLFILPPKIVCGFLANVLLLQSCSHSVIEAYLSTLIGRSITGYIQALLPHKVLLFEASAINSELVRNGFGRHVDRDTFLLLVEMLTEVPLKQNTEPVPDLLIEKSRGQEFYFRPSDLQGYENILSFCRPRLSCGTHAKVRVTAAVNPGLFYCQMASVETDLLEMSRKLAIWYEYRTKERHQKTPENLSLLCSVKGKDEKWYRGLVPFLPVNSQVRVLFIDYGFYESVEVENIHRLPPELYSTPIMAFPCSLSSVADKDEVLRTQQLSFLKLGLLGGVLDMMINRFDEEHHLYCVTVVGAEDNCLKEPEPIQKLPVTKVESVSEPGELLPQVGYLYHEKIMGETLGNTLKVEEVQVDSVFVGYVEHVQNPNLFWIRTEKRNEEFEEMMSKITKHFSQVKLDEDILLNPELGTVCCALYKGDMHFYRAVVTDILEHGAEVLFIDFGNTEKVPHMVIKNIPKSFASKSAFAICCTLFNVIPLDDVWTRTATDLFRRAVSNKALLVHVIQIKKNKFVVDLFEMGSDRNQSVTELLVSSKQAEYITIGHVAQNKTEKTRCPQSNIRTDISGDKEQWKDCEEEKKTCRNESEKGQASASVKALSVKPGCEFAVCCSYISSPSDFWCQPLHMAPALEELMDKIQQYYSVHTVPLQSGELCCVVKSPQDGKWYRALITAKQKCHVTVMLLDYGCTIQVNEHSLQAIMPDFVQLEGQAFRCSLYNQIEPADPKNCGDWSPETCSLLKDFIVNSGAALKCEVVSQLNVKNKGLYNVVHLYNIQTQQSVTDTLLEQGLARRATMSTKQQPAVFPESFTYSSHDLHPGNEEQVYVTHVKSQWEVYCHLDRNTGIIDELEEKISEESEKMIHSNIRTVVRKLCLAKYLDGNWYRGVAHPVHSPLHFSVFFVDYGNTKITENTSVMFIPRDRVDLLYIPMQAVKCCLHSVSKEDIDANVKEWLSSAVLCKQVRAVILGKNEDGSFDVELFDGDVSINEKVKELILSLSCKPKAAVKIDTIRTGLKCKTYCERNRKTLLKWKSQPRGQSSNVLTAHAHKGTKRRENTRNLTSKRTQNGDTKLRPQNLCTSNNGASIKTETFQVKQQREYQDAKSKEPQLNEATDLLCLPDKKIIVGFRAKCFVSHIDSIYRFFLQLSEDEPAILKMGEDLNSGSPRDSLKTPTTLGTSDVVLAEFEEDGALYRSAVKNYAGSSCYKVEFVDYGNSAVLGKEKIFSIPKEHLSQPRFSIECSLLDASAYKNNASFTDAVMEKPLMVDFIQQCEANWEVQIKILDEDVSLHSGLEVAFESSLVTEKEDKSLMAEANKKLKFPECKKLTEDVCENKIIKSERKVSTTEGKNMGLKPTPVIVSVKTGVKTRKPRRRSRKKSESTKRLADAFLPPSIRTRDTEKGTILSVWSSGSFYVRLAQTSDLLTVVESHIADSLYTSKMVAREDIKQGLKCVVQGQSNKTWQRAVVRHLNGETLKVFLVDHGISMEIPSSSIRQQSSDLSTIPNLAVLCKINMLGLSEKDDNLRLWCETLKPMIGKEVQLVFMSYCEADDLWMVEIVMNQLFLICQTGGLPQQNEETIPTPAEDEGYEKGLTLDTSPPPQLAFAPIERDGAYSGFAAAVTTPFDFCVTIEDLLLVMNKVSLLLDDLPGQMLPLPKGHIAPGTCCLLKSDSRKKWCRAEIIHADTTVGLNLVDYDHYECVTYDDCSDLKRLPVEITNLPKVNYPCMLRGVKPAGVDRQWTDEASVFFRQCLYQKNLQIVFREFVLNTHWKVDVIVDGIHVAKTLVDAGHANYIDVMLRLRFLEQSSNKSCPHGPNSEEEEEEGGQEYGGSDAAEGKMPLDTVSRSAQCFYSEDTQLKLLTNQRWI